ncbi:WD repeat-containing protein 27-like [Glandiceps talaboti]
MAAIHEYSIRTPFLPSHLQIACNDTYLALPYTKATVGIWSMKSLPSSPLQLEGHRKQIKCMCFGKRHSPTVLCSAANDFIITWNVEKARSAVASGQQVRGQVISKGQGYVQYVNFSPDDNLVAACIDKEILILDSKSERIDTRLEGHTATVNCAEFCPHYDSTVVSISDDRTFKVWDISNSCLVYQSTIISASPFISLSMDMVNPQFAVGSCDGQMRIYDLTDGNGFRCLHQLDVAKILRRQREAKDQSVSSPDKTGPTTISSRPSWQLEQSTDDQSAAMNVDELSEASEAVLGLYYALRPDDNGSRKTSGGRKPSFLQTDDSIVCDLLEKAPMLLVATPGCLIQINTHSYEVASYIDFQDPLPSESSIEETHKYISLSGSFSFAQTEDIRQVWCLVGSLFQKTVSLLKIQHPSCIPSRPKSITNQFAETLHIGEDGTGDSVTSEKIQTTGEDIETEITVLSSTPLLANSPLKSDLVPKTKETTPPKKGKLWPPAGAKKGVVNTDNQPLTFKSKVKSSGYTDPPRMNMFSPITNKSRSSAGSRHSKPNSANRTLIKEYPMDAEYPTNIKIKLSVAEQPTPINCISFSDDGQNLAAALSNKSSQVFKMPLTGKGTAFTGHNGVVNSVSWSHSNQWLLTSSDDRTARLWHKTQTEPVLTIDNSSHNFTADKEGPKTVDKSNPPFTKEIKHCRFYYVDKFILVTCGNTMYMYKYHLDDKPRDDIKRYLTNNRYKLVKTLQMDRAQQLTALSSVNGFHSYIILCAGSNKSMEVFDMNTAQSVRILPDVHTRPVHTICQNEGSTYVSHPANAYDLFLTAAATDGIKLWDLRTNRCVRRYDGHMNRVHSCGLAFSPCAKYIATGSEDRTAYIFDIRAGTYVHRFTGHTDVVSDVLFHPLYPELVTASMDGKIRLYSNR